MPILADNRFLYGYQRWYLLVTNDGKYAKILNDASGLLAGALGKADSEVVAVYSPEKASKWQFEPIHMQHCFFICLEDSDLAWTLEGNRVVLRPLNQSKEQQWILVNDDKLAPSQQIPWRARVIY
ncbi:hypothetical protein BGW42_002249 [Actinomortierella wolfii]|nr:hypothetical protein BGW42_002249 [Actinomortierella wolfii]